MDSTRAQRSISNLRLARSWIQMQRHWWAHLELGRLCREQPRRAWSALQAIAKAANTVELQERLGAGALQEFIRAHAPGFIGQIERRATQDTRFRHALSKVWVPHADDAVSRRLFKLGCQPISSPHPAKWQARARNRRGVLSNNAVKSDARQK